MPRLVPRIHILEVHLLRGAYLVVVSWAGLMRGRGEKWSAACGGLIFFYKRRVPKTRSTRYHSSRICKGDMRLDKIRSFGTVEKFNWAKGGFGLFVGSSTRPTSRNPGARIFSSAMLRCDST